MALAGAPGPRLEHNLDQDNRPDRRQKPSGGYRCDLKLGCFAKKLDGIRQKASVHQSQFSNLTIA
jgi:hypothetical protein